MREVCTWLESNKLKVPIRKSTASLVNSTLYMNMAIKRLLPVVDIINEV